MDSNTDRVVANRNLEDIVNNYNTWNHLTMCKFNLFLNVTYKQST